MKALDLNDTVTAKLTDYGLELWIKHETKYLDKFGGDALKYTLDKIERVRKTKIIEDQLWCLFQIFGGENIDLGHDVCLSNIKLKED